MRNINGILLVLLVFLNSCAKKAAFYKQNQSEPPAVPTVNPAGKWVSIAFYSDNAWQSIAMPHYIEFRNDQVFSFRDQNGVICSGQYAVSSPLKVYTLIDFPVGECGLTTRIADLLLNDTLVLTVVSPPNITQTKVKYLRQP